ncbi:hypothetical protein FQA39_LY13290 [Lamprigera yunnana]|nr:hypothetical protein FQA39_LY13290 [Lamprigera yunnana]
MSLYGITAYIYHNNVHNYVIKTFFVVSSLSSNYQFINLYYLQFKPLDFIMKYIQLKLCLGFFWYNSVDLQATAVDKFLPQFRILLDNVYSLLTPYTESKANLEVARKQGKLQQPLHENINFPCNVNNQRSKNRPTSVHQLQPGDIDVIGALGDSLTAGNGIIATDPIQPILQNRGLSFSIGGQDTWKRYTTLPNILKLFNPNLLGYAFKDSFINHNYSQLNVAEAGAMSIDMPFMSKELIKRIKHNPQINLNNDWKMISLMIGGNDFCGSMCYYNNPEDILKLHKKNLLQTLRNLRDNLPKTLVNLVLAPHLSLLRNVTRKNQPAACYFTHNILCPCLFGLQFLKKQRVFDEIMSKWQDIEREISSKEEFNRNDFTVVVQPFTQNYFIPTKNGLTDYSSFSYDCFHLSQKEHARAATSLWNNLLQPVGQKSTMPFETFKFLCPSKMEPFLFTNNNSKIL